MVQKRKTKETRYLLFGLVLIVFGILMSQFSDSLLRFIFNRELTLRPGSWGFREWRYSRYPVTLKVYFWNWTNPEQIYEENYKPAFVEMGPYAFKIYLEKVNVTFNDNGTISYRILPRCYLDEENTKGSLSDYVTSVNVIAASASYMTRTYNRWFLFPVSEFLRSNGQKIYWTKNVSQLLFEGFENPVLNAAGYVPGFGGLDKFGWLYGYNGTVLEELYNVYNGLNNISDVGQTYSINYKNKSDIYPDCYIAGSAAGELYSPNINKNQPLKMYFPQFCRSVSHYYDGESSYKGLKTYVFSGTKLSMDSGNLVEGNKCYCKKEPCTPNGFLDIAECQKGAPLFMSHPHFITADPYYQNAVKGMNPDPLKHKSFTQLEPLTGVQFNASLKTQMNVFITNNPGISIFRNIPDFYIPVFWVETSIQLQGLYFAALTMLVILLEYGLVLWYGLTILGILIVLAVATFHYYINYSLNLTSFRDLPKNQSDECEALRKAEEEKLQTKEENKLANVKFVVSQDKAPILE